MNRRDFLKLFAVVPLLFLSLSLCARECRVSTTGGFALKGTVVSAEPRLFLPGWKLLSPQTDAAADEGGSAAFSFKAEAATVSGRASFVAEPGGRISARWFVTSDRLVEVEQLFVGFPLGPVGSLGSYVADGKRFPFPKAGEKFQFGPGEVRALKLCGTDGGEIVSLAFAKPARIGFQDNTRFGGGFEMRVLHREKTLAPGRLRTFEMTLSTPDGLTLVEPRPVTLTAGRDWLPFAVSADIRPGSALDFSAQSGLDAPAGKYGRVVVRNGHFEFAQKPGVPQRFYGFNLCFGANYFNTKAAADKFAERVARLGYNAVRLHHHDGLLVSRTKDSVTVNPDRLRELDALVAAFVERGLYVTTDLYVSRRVPWREIGVDRAGNVEMGQFKDLVRTNELAFANLCAFSKNWLTHVNAYTGRRWADEPGLAWISLVNENCPDNMRRPGAAEFASLQAAEDRFYARLTKFLRDEVGAKQLFTDLNGWSQNPGWGKCRSRFDYVDMHFYVDHPRFLAVPWKLPSACANANPLRGAEPAGVASCGKTRLAGKPFTVTEWNFSGPGRFRGVGGIVTGAWAAREDWDGLWRFAWSHSHDGVAAPGDQPMTYFDVSSDPLMLAGERATVCLFLRGDLASGDGKGLSVDGKNGRLLIDTPRTCGGFAEGGRLRAGVLAADMGETPATVWTSSLDGQPIATSRRLLFCHLTDVQDTGVHYADDTMKVLLKWGKLPHLMRAGRADISLAVSPGQFEVFVLNEDGSRRETVPSAYRSGALSFTAEIGRTPGRAAYVYEIVARRDALCANANHDFPVLPTVGEAVAGANDHIVKIEAPR